METDHNRDANPPATTSMTVAQFGENDPFLIEVTTIMADMESLVKAYVHEMKEMVLQYLGGVEMTLYLGHIFSTGLNFQTSMWQLIMFEAIDLPTVMREQLHREMGILHLFDEVIPFLRPCSVPPLPIPVIEQPTLLMSKETPGMSISNPPLSSLADNSQPMAKVAELGALAPMQGTPMGNVPKQNTPLSSRQRLQSKVSLKLLSCVTAPAISGSKGANKAVVHVAPSRKAQKPSMSVSLSPLLLSLAQSSSSVRCCPGGSISLGSQPKRPKLDESANQTGPGTSAEAAITIDNGADDGNKDDIKILIDGDEDDDNDNDNNDDDVVANADVNAQ